MSPKPNKSYESIDTDRFSGVEIVEATADDAQSRIQSAEPNTEIWVHGGAYDPGSETHIPPDVALYFLQSAWWEPSTDYSGFFLDLGSQASIRAITANTPFASPNHVAALDSNRASSNGRYDQGAKIDGAILELYANGSGMNGHAVVLDAGTNSITLGANLHIDAYQYETALRADTGLNWINFEGATVRSDKCQKAIHHLGDGPFRTQVDGYIQPATDSTAGILNDTSKQSCTFFGHIWDAGNIGDGASNGILVGPNITAYVTNGAAIAGFVGKCAPNSAGQQANQIATGMQGSARHYYNGEYDSIAKLDFRNGQLHIGFGPGAATMYQFYPTQVRMNNNVEIRGGSRLRLYNSDNSVDGGLLLDSNGNFVIDAPLRFNEGVTMEATPPTDPSTNDAYLDTGANTADGSPGWRYTTDGGTTWNDMN